MSKTLLAMSSSQDSCVAMRQSDEIKTSIDICADAYICR